MTSTPDRIAALKQRADDTLDQSFTNLASAAQEAALAALLVSTPQIDLERASLERVLGSSPVVSEEDLAELLLKFIHKKLVPLYRRALIPPASKGFG